MKAALPILAALLSAATAAASITGTVIGDDGKLIAGAAVRIYAADDPTTVMRRMSAANPDRQPLATAQTSETGAFSLDGKGALLVAVVIDAPSKQVLETTAVDGDDLGTLVTVPAAPRTIHVTAGSKPIAGARIVSSFGLIGKTDERGLFEWSGSGPQPSLVVHPDYAQQFAGAGGMNPKSIEIKLSTGVTIRGRVLGADGPVAHAQVAAGNSFAETGADGSFVIEHAAAPRTVIARIAKLAGSAQSSTAKPIEIRLGPAATISGNVRDEKGTPVSGARVSAFSSEGSAAAISDAKGNYTITSLVPADYTIAASHPDYTIASGGPQTRISGNVTRNLTATPRALIRGVVVDEEKKPVAAAFVWTGARDAGLNRIGTTITNAAGEFAVRGPNGNVNGSGTERTSVFAAKRDYALGTAQLTEGSRVSVVLPRGFPLQVKVIDRSRQAVEHANVAPFERDDDDRRPSRGGAVCAEPLRRECFVTSAQGTSEFRISDGSYAFFVAGEGIVNKNVPAARITARSSPVTIEVERSVTVIGRVTYSDGAPVADAMVMSRTGGGMPTRTDVDGTFTMQGLPAGKATLVASTGTTSRVESTPLEVTAPARGVTLVIPRPGRIKGRVVDRVTRQPITDFTVAVQREDRRGSGGPPQTIHAADGAFAVENVAPGEASLRITASGYVVARRAGIVVEEGKPTSGIEMQLDRGAKLTGRVTAGGQPISGVSVQRVGTRNGGSPVQTDANGEYTMDNLEAGDVTIEFRHQSYIAKRKDAAVEAGKDARLDVELERGRELQGRVTDASGVPVSGVRVTADSNESPGPRAGATTSPDGTFKLEGLSDGHYTLNARKEGYLPGNEPVDVPASSAVIVKLERGGTVTGHVSGVDASEMSMVMVSWSGRGGGFSARPDASGNFTLNGVPDGQITVQAATMGQQQRRTASKTVEVSGGAATVQLELSEGFTVRGRVTTGGAPLRGGTVVFNQRRQMAGTNVFVGGMQRGAGVGPIDANGDYEVSGLGSGTFDVRVNSSAGMIHQTTYNVTGSGTFDIDVRGTALRGRALDARTGAPLADVSVMVVGGAQSRGVRDAVTDSEGRFSIDVIPAGSYKLTAQRDRYAAVTRDVEVSDSAPADVELRLEPAQAMVVRTTDAQSGRPVDAFVSVTPADAPNGPGVQGARGEVGETRVYLAPGRYHARVAARGYVAQQTDFAAPGPEVRVSLSPAGRVMVVARTQRLIRFTASGASRPSWGPAPVPQAAIESLPPGSYTLDVLDEKRNVVKSYPVIVVAGQTVTVEIE